jgi:hypothetical protein
MSGAGDLDIGASARSRARLSAVPAPREQRHGRDPRVRTDTEDVVTLPLAGQPGMAGLRACGASRSASPTAGSKAGTPTYLKLSARVAAIIPIWITPRSRIGFSRSAGRTRWARAWRCMPSTSAWFPPLDDPLLGCPLPFGTTRPTYKKHRGGHLVPGQLPRGDGSRPMCPMLRYMMPPSGAWTRQISTHAHLCR